MKYILISVLIILSSCSKTEQEYLDLAEQAKMDGDHRAHRMGELAYAVESLTNSTFQYGVAVFDSCEYIYMGEYRRGYLAHKGNCKNCLKRDTCR